MKALILAAGYGTRLGVITQETPKPLLQVGERPILDFAICKLLEIGISEIIINTHFKSKEIEAFISKQVYSKKVILSYEEKLLGTLGTLRKHIDFLTTSDFLVMHADNYFTDNLLGLVDVHRKRSDHIIASMATFITDRPEECGVVTVDEDNEVVAFFEKIPNPPSRVANAAIYIFSPFMRSEIGATPNTENDISKNLIPRLIGKMVTHQFTGPLIDIGTPEGLNRARKLAET
jgi:mannose-1-phosphate guanylyltransferase